MDIEDIKEKLKNPSIDTSVEFTPQNPFTIEIPPDANNQEAPIANAGYPVEPEKTSLLESAKQEFEQTSSLYHLYHAANAPLAKPANSVAQYYYPEINDKFYHPAAPGWSPKQEIDKLTNLDPRFIPKLLGAKNPDDFHYQLDSINEETNRTQELQNGSTMGKIFGGVGGYTVGSIENLIPYVVEAKIAKLGNAFFTAMIKNAPGVLAASAIHEGAYEMDKVDGNLHDFLKDTFIDAAFGTVFFGGLGAAKTLVNMSEMGRLKTFARDFLDGIGFNYKVDKKGNLTGFEAVDTTGGSVGAAKLSRAQKQADSAFHKGPIFKVPYLGPATFAVLSGNIPGFKYVFGSPLIQLKTSKYKAANAFADAAFDHFITTEGEAKGGTRPKAFEFKMKQTRAALTRLKMLTDALHAERNGYKIQARPTLNLQNAWNANKQKSIEALSRESKSTDWISQDDFMDEAQRVMYSGDRSEHAATNTLADIYRKIKDDTWRDHNKAFGLKEDWMPPRTADEHLMRVYDTPFMNSHDGQKLWNDVIPQYFAEADAVIEQRMGPIKDLEAQIAAQTEAHEKLIRSSSGQPLTDSLNQLKALKRKHKVLSENLQNELRSNRDLLIHADDPGALSANEAKEMAALTKRRDIALNEIKEQKKFIVGMKKKIASKKAQAMKAKTIPTGKKNLRKSDTGLLALEKEETKLRELEREHEEEVQKIQEAIANNQVNPRLYYKEEGSSFYKLKNPKNRLKFRDVHESDFHRQQSAKAAYNSILQMHPEDVIADMFGKLMGNADSNPLKARTLMVPDELLYNNGFMTKDLYAKTSNYVNFLARRTHLKTSFNNVTVDGNFEELAVDLLNEHNEYRGQISNRIEELSSKEGNEKKIKKLKKAFDKEVREYNGIKKVMKNLYENRMMGINKRNDFDVMARRFMMSVSSAINLHNLPITQITDVAWAGFQHGIWPSVRDGIYPMIESMGGMLRTKDAEALREMAPHVNLGLQDMLNNYADKNWHSELQPTINMGKIINGVEKLAHFSALTDLSPYIDNAVQRMNGSIIQSRFMQLLHKQMDGALSKKDSLYLRKYGIDPEVWAKRMTDAYKKTGGFKTKLGGYMSKSWLWQDMEASNVFDDAVFRGIQNTLVWKGMADSPLLADNLLGLFFHTFTGWVYASTNRYIIPALQHPDGELLLKAMWMYGAGSLVSPMRRLSRGEDMWPDDMNDKQRAYEAFLDSGVASTLANVLKISNFLSDDRLLGDLKNDKFKHRMRTGIFGMGDVISSTASRISDVLGMANSGINEKDMKTAARLLPITGAMYSHYLSDKLIESWGLPRNKRAAKFENG